MSDGKTMGISRRTFLNRTVLAAATVSIVPRRVLGGPGHTAPNDIITRAVIGTGGMGHGHIKPYPQTLAVCDVDKNHVASGKKKAGGDCTAYTDWRDVLERDDIDTIHIATPPHWHALMTIAAAQAGKDIYCEKPFSHTIREGRVAIETIRRFGRVCQINSHGRPGGRRFRKLLDSGVLGWPVTACLGPGQQYNWKVKQWSGRHNLAPEPIPDVLDYDMWLGPAPWKPYHSHRVHRSFRGYWDYDGGGLTDMGMHYLDPVQYALNKAHTSPTEIEAYAPWPQHPDAVDLWGHVIFTYEDGTRIIIESGEWGKTCFKDQPFLEGPKGKVWKDGRTDPPGLWDEIKQYPDPPAMVDWEDALKTRNDWGGHRPNAETGHRGCTLVNLAIIAIRTGRKIHYDPVAECVIGDEEANRLVDQPMRAPWHLV